MFLSRLFKSKTMLALTALSILSLLVMGSSAPVKPFPETISLPNGFRPEGIVTGNGTTFYVGSIPTGAIYKGDYRTGEGEILVPGQPGRMAIGLAFDSRTGLLFVSGGPTGHANIYDAGTGAEVASIQLTTSSNTFVNDVVVTQNAAYFTESFQPVLYRVPLENTGELPNPASGEEIPLSGDFDFVAGGFNTNGIDATPNGKTLIIVNSTTGSLYTVDPDSGESSLIDLDGNAVPFGDGILLQGKTLYVVQNQLDLIAVVDLNANLTAGTVEREITSPFFDIPTTVARFGSSLYAVNARFGTIPTPDTEYDVVRVPNR